MKQSLGAKTIAYPTPVFIIGSYDAAGKPNLMSVSWGGICCSDPPSMAISVREATHTYASIAQRMAYTINIPSEDQVKEADYVGTCSGRDVDKFGTLGLTPVRSDLVDAPYIAEFPLVIECKVSHSLNLGLHTLFVGHIMDVKTDQAVLRADGSIDVEKLRPFSFSPMDQIYYKTGGFLANAFSVGKTAPRRPGTDAG